MQTRERNRYNCAETMCLRTSKPPRLSSLGLLERNSTWRSARVHGGITPPWCNSFTVSFQVVLAAKTIEQRNNPPTRGTW